MKKLLFLFGFFAVLSTSSFAQIDKEKAIRPKGELKLADYLYAQGHYYSAAEYYKEYIRQEPENRYAKYWLAMAYLEASNYEEALKWFESFKNHRPGPKANTKRIEKEDKEIYQLFSLYYGIALKHNEKYSEAIKQLNKFKSSYASEVEIPKEGKKEKKTTDEEDYVAKAKIELLGAQLGALNLKSKKQKISSIGDAVNTGYSEAAPVVVSDSVIYYSSLNEDNLLFVRKSKDIPPYRMFQAVKVDGAWEKGKRLPSVLNDEDFGTGNAALSEDGNRLYFCKCLNVEIDEVICNLYLSEKKGNKWGEPEKLNEQINSPKYTSTQPTVRSGGDNFDIVYFVSDREGGKGGMDIWYFIRTNSGNYKGPRLLGGGINTKFDELTPYYNNDENLFYFSSNGHPSLGGFDVFMSKEDEDLGWIEPSNVGKPINSPADDLYYTREAEKTSGFLVSNREGTELINKRYRGDDIFYFEDYIYGLEGFVLKEDVNGESPLEGATIRLYTDDAYGNEILVEELQNVKDGYFFALKPDKAYKIEVEKPGYSKDIEYISTMDIPYSDTINQNLVVDKTSFIALGSVYEDTDTLKETKLTDAIVTLQEILPNGKAKTITAKRLTDSNSDFSFNLDEGKNYEISVVKDGYFKNKIEISTSNLPNTTDEILSDLVVTKIEVGKTYELENILYDFGKSTLRDQSKVILDGLVDILRENPAIIIELAAHTDAIGSDAANLKLSQARAQSCVDYLISKGISKERLIAKGYGEAKPIAPNENEDGSDNEAGRQKNRRTEFTVVGGF